MSDFYVKKGFPAGLDTPITATADNDIPNLSQVNSLIAGSASVYDSVRVEEDSNIDLATGGLLTVDGVTVIADDRVLVAGQTIGSENGIYVAASGAWSRATDMATDDEVKAYAHVFVREGTEHGGHEMKLQTTNASETVGTDVLTFVHAYTLDNDASHIDVSDTSFTELTGTDVQTVLDSVDDVLAAADTRLDNLSGVTGSDLGTFTGAIITDAGDIKTGMQELSDAIENIDVSGDIATYYTGQKYQVTGQSIAANTYTTITHSLDEAYPSGVEIYNLDGLRETASFEIDLIDANSLRIKNETATVFTDMIVVVRA
jgi:phage-related tail fiber protein